MTKYLIYGLFDPRTGELRYVRLKLKTDLKLPKRHSPETRAKMSAARMGRVVTEETRRRISEAHKLRYV